MTNPIAIVLANDKPKSLDYTIRYLMHIGWGVSIHLDSKQDFEKYTSNLSRETIQYCQWIKNRKNIHWGGYNMIEATLELIKENINKTDQLILLSDDTIPIAPPKELSLAADQAIDRMDSRIVSEEEIFYKRYEKFFYFDSKATSLLGREIESSHFTDEDISEILNLIQLRIKGKEKIEVRYGSQWWWLTSRSIGAITKEIETNHNLRNSFRYTAIPDEMMIQSIYPISLNSTPPQPSPTKVDWTRNPRPYVFSTAEEILREIKNRDKNKYFLRKIHLSDAEIQTLKERNFDEYGINFN